MEKEKEKENLIRHFQIPHLEFFLVAPNGVPVGKVSLEPVEGTTIPGIPGNLDEMDHVQLIELRDRTSSFIGDLNNRIENGHEKPEGEKPEAPKPAEPPKPAKPRSKPRKPRKPRKPSKPRSGSTARRNARDQTLDAEMDRQATEEPETPQEETPPAQPPATETITPEVLQGLSELQVDIMLHLNSPTPLSFGQLKEKTGKGAKEVFEAIKTLTEMGRIAKDGQLYRRTDIES